MNGTDGQAGDSGGGDVSDRDDNFDGRHIREADDNDKAELVRMLEALQRYAANNDPIGRIHCGTGFGEHAHTELAEVVANQQGRIIVIDNGRGGLDGFCAGFVCRPQTETDLLDVHPNTQGYLAKLYVSDHLRGGRWGSRLVEQIEAHLSSCGCDNIWVDTNAFNPAVEFYAQLGYTPREIGLLKPVTPSRQAPHLSS